MSAEWKDCGNVQCAQVHAVLDSLLQWLEVECPESIYTVGKSVRIVDAINKLKEQKQWRTDALKDAHDDKGKLRAEIHDLKHEITAAQFVKYWDGLSFKQHCLLAAQSLLKAASIVE
jgi:hypothetical protein